MTHLLTYKSREKQATALATLVAGQLADALAEKTHATLAVPGGTTPAPFLRALSKAAIDWSKISVLLSDERFVPENSERSNTRLLHQTLLQGPAEKARLIPMITDAPDAQTAADILAPAIHNALPLDVCVLGMGNDMHTASLFPGADNLAPALDPNTAEILLPMLAPGAAEPRLTLTAAVLRAATHTHILITGPEKLQALEQAEAPGPATEAPIRTILSGSGNISIHHAD